jgi:hypothetical protein
MIDAAWRVARAPPKKKEAANGSENGPPLEDLQLLPIGQDLRRKRYWVVDGEYPFCSRFRRSSALFLPYSRLHRFSSGLYFDKPMEDNFGLGSHLFLESGIRIHRCFPPS